MTYRIQRVDAEEHRDDLVLIQELCMPDEQPVFSTGSDEWWFAFDDDTPIAVACLSPSVRWPKTGYLSRSGVRAAHRGHGLQRRLIRVRERRARALGWQWMVTETCENPYSANNLVACGYTLYEPRKPWGHANAIYWRRRIADGEVAAPK